MLQVSFVRTGVTLARMGLLTLLGATLSCAPKKQPLSRNPSEEQKNGAAVPSGKFPQLGSPSVAMRSACARSSQGIDCAKLPWSLEDYNKIAAVVDSVSEACTHQVFVKSDSPASLLNQGNKNGTAVTTVFQDTALEIVGPDVPGSVAFIQVKYTDAQMKSFGNTANAEPPTYIERSQVTCKIPEAAASSGLEDSQSERGQSSSENSGRATGGTGTQAAAAAKPASGATLSASQGQQNSSGTSNANNPTKPLISVQIARMTCKADVPFHAKFIPWATPMCDKVDGTSLTLQRQDDVVLKRSPESGTPVTYYETNRNCYIKAENIEIKTCKPL